MVLEQQPLPFNEWISTSLIQWLTVIGAVGLVALILGFVITAVFHGPGRAGDMIYRLLASAVVDLVRISPRRVIALARLAIQESLRRRVLAGLGVFIVILAFAIWFLDARAHDPAKLYLSFVLTATNWLVLLMVLFLSAFSLPNDIKHHTIYTIVTKPVRPSEIVLGRMLGFAAVGTALIAVMALFSYVFVVRALNHTHELSIRDLTSVAASGESTEAQLTGRTGLTRNHRHQITLNDGGSGSTEAAQGHWHDITIEGSGDDARVTVGPPQGQFHARVPIYGKLAFIDRSGQLAKEGLNVGNEWTYRSFIEGGTLMAARWLFKDVRREDFPNGMRLNMTISVFRTHKGNIEQTVLGSYTLRNPRTKVASPPQNFFAKEFAIDDRVVPLSFKDTTGKTIDLFDDLVDNGELEIELTCLQGGQYFGMAQPDLYLLPREGSFEGNFVKGYVGIWLQMVMVVAFGVMWSTFLNGSVAMLATVATLIVGQFAPWVQELATGKVIGGNSFEAFLRIVTQSSISTPLDDSLAATVVQGLDAITLWPLKIVASLLPDFGRLNDADYVAEGFNIPSYLIAEQTLTTLAFVVPIFIIGYLCLKTREVAK